MTPAELLEQAQSHFLVLYHNDPEALDRLLREALGKYQDKAGVIEQISLGTLAEIEVPEHFLKIAVAQDATGNYHEASVVDGQIQVTERTSSTKPYTVHYFVDLKSYDLDEVLPQGIVGTVLDYLVALIDIPNTQRTRRILQATGQQGELPTDDVLLARRDQIVQDMENEEAIVPMVVVRS
jgi:hypothetical protein